ncbi:MAG: hypothetical protein ACTIM4_09225 [Marinomonas sp.]
MSADSNLKRVFWLARIWLKNKRLADFNEKSVTIHQIIRSLEIGSS